MNYEDLRSERDHLARMCAVYTAAGHYDLAKKYAGQYIAAVERMTAYLESQEHLALDIDRTVKKAPEGRKLRSVE